MYFETLSAALEMDGHGGFVWAAYAITFFVLFVIVVAPVRKHARVMRQLHGQFRRELVSSQQGDAR